MEIGAITFDNTILNGEAIFTNTRIPVKTLFNSLDSGESIDDFLHDFPQVSRFQVEEVIVYARKLITSIEVIKSYAALLDIPDNPFFPTTNILQFEASLGQLINDYRNSLGLLPFIYNEEIATIAREHSMNMAKQIVPFDHTGLQLRFSRAGQAVNRAGVGENLASGFTNAQDVLQGWLNESSHKENLEKNAKYAGIGMAQLKERPTFFTMLIVQ